MITDPRGSRANSAPGPGAGADLQVGVLGPLVLSRGGVEIEIGPAMVRNLLALLALHPGRSVPRGEIVDVLWDGDPPATVVNLLHVYVSRLRAQLRGTARGGADDPRAIVLDGDGYRLDVGPEAVDLSRFVELLGRARRAVSDGAVAAAVGGYEAALRCWRGPVLADLDPRFRQLPVVVAADERRIAAAVELAGLYNAAGHHAAATSTLTPLVDAAPLHEGLHLQRMLALAGTGNRAGALAGYDGIRRLLAEQLGVDPGAELRAVHLRLLRDGDGARDGARDGAPASRGEPAEPVPDAAAAPGTGPARPVARRPRWRLAVTAGATALLIAAAALAVPAVRGRVPGDQTGHQPPAIAPPAGPAGYVAFATSLHWSWVWSRDFGTTPTGEQRVRAQVSGLVDDQTCTGIRTRVVTGPDPAADPSGDEGEAHGLLFVLCGDHWAIESVHPEDSVRVPAAVAPSGTLEVALSADNLLTATYAGTVLTSRQLPRGRYRGRHLYLGVWQGHGGPVLLTEVLTSATTPAGGGASPDGP